VRRSRPLDGAQHEVEPESPATWLEWLRRERNEAEIPISLVWATHALPDAAHDLGVRAVLAKQFDVGILLAIVERLARPNQI
jgi:hypothetical protein